MSIEPLQKKKYMSKTLCYSEKHIFTIAGIINKFYLKKKMVCKYLMDHWQCTPSWVQEKKGEDTYVLSKTALKSFYD